MPEDSDLKPTKRSLRPVAFAAVAFSTISVLACVITLPMVYHHVQSVQSFMQNEVDFCKVNGEWDISFCLLYICVCRLISNNPPDGIIVKRNKVISQFERG